jgi:NADPH-dependent 7-cyano-7-deazaguanine reductase QueF
MTAILDKFLGKWASRKLTVFAIATALMSFGKIESVHWAWIAIAYIVIQGLVDAKELLKYFNK